MKKLFFILFAITTLLLFASCNLYAGFYPEDYGPSKWVCESPKAWFAVGSNHRIKGVFEQYGEQLDFELGFGYSNYAVFSHDGETILAGEASFLPEKLAIKIDQTKNFVYGSDVEILVFELISYEHVLEEGSSENLASFSAPIT